LQPDRPLRLAFRFDAGDLQANRGGRLSARQETRLRAGHTGMRLSLAVFALVMLGILGIIAFANLDLSGRALGGDGELAMGIIVAVVVAVIAFGYRQSRGYMAAARSRQVQVAAGPAEVAADGLHVRIGATRLRLAGEEQVGAFTPGAEYRVYYLAGPVPIVLSAEVAGAGPAPDSEEEAAPSVADGQVAVIRRGYVIVVLIGVIALVVPIAGIAAGRLSPGLQSAVWIGLFGATIGLAWFAVRWLGSRDRPPS
jgi:hypothetical protein